MHVAYYRKMLSKVIQIYYPILIIVGILTVYEYVVLVRKISKIPELRDREFTGSTKSYLLDTKGCKIPKLDPLHNSIIHLFKSLPNLPCDATSYSTLKNYTLRMRSPNYSKHVNCSIQPIYRINDSLSELGIPVPVSEKGLKITSEFVKVECEEKFSQAKSLQFYPFVFPKERVEQRIERYKQINKAPKRERLRIIMLGLDSVSKGQFLRHMLKTHLFIKQHLTYAELHGYNKIGKNTYSNVVAMFTGQLEDELPDTSNHSADVLPLIWKEYRENGYRTQYNEDFPPGTAFNYGRKGFDEEPADYYLRPWSLAVEPFISNWTTGCINERVEASVIFKYMEDFFDLFPSDPLFAFTFLTRLSHDYINQLAYHDTPVRDLLERLYLKGHFNNTIMFLFGDHGFRFGDIRTTHAGRIEGRLPLMFIILPPWFPDTYPQLYRNLKINERRLTTCLDIYATLKHLLHFDGEGFEREGSGRSISLLKHQIPLNRTCENASIKNQWCACSSSEPISVDDKGVKMSASVIVDKINSITERYRVKCAELSLSSILSARKQDVGLGEDSVHDGHTNFLVTLQVTPSNGIFEGSVWFDGSSSYTPDNTMERINLYRNQSACVDENFLKPFCYCI